VLCEQILFEAHGEERFPATVFRPPHIMGSGSQLGTGSLQNRDPMLLSRMQQRSPVVLLDGGQLLIQPAHHRDIGRACAAALGKPATFGRAYHCSGPECVTSKEYYDLVAAALGIEDPAYLSFPSAEFVRLFPERAPFAFHRMYSMDRLATDTGYRPRTTIAHAIFEMIDWLQATGNAKEFVETEQDTAMAALCQAFTEEARKVLSS
jgi:nucleoside-diphosphate-sugar epimerase